MPEGLLKMDHPSFFESAHIDGDFRPRGGIFCLFRSVDIFAGPGDDVFSCQTPGRHHCNRSGPGSSAGRYKTQNRTTGIELRAITRRASLRSCKPPEDGLDLNQVGASGVFAVALHLKLEVAASGFSFLFWN